MVDQKGPVSLQYNLQQPVALLSPQTLATVLAIPAYTPSCRYTNLEGSPPNTPLYLQIRVFRI